MLTAVSPVSPLNLKRLDDRWSFILYAQSSLPLSLPRAPCSSPVTSVPGVQQHLQSSVPSPFLEPWSLPNTPVFLYSEHTQPNTPFKHSSGASSTRKPPVVAAAAYSILFLLAHLDLGLVSPVRGQCVPPARDLTSYGGTPQGPWSSCNQRK